MDPAPSIEEALSAALGFCKKEDQMQVSDLLLQYQNSLAAGSEVSTGTKGIEQLVDTAKQLRVGSIFEGSVNDIKGKMVTLGLSSGQNIVARLDKGVTLTKGQSFFFQVKSNDGIQVQIKPVSGNGFAGNPTLLQALDAASLPVTENSLNMVNAMMKEHMPIDAKSLQDMSRIMIQAKGAAPATVVEMTRLQIPLTESNIRQFENYKEDQGEVLKQVDGLLDSLAAMSEDENLTLEEQLSLQKNLAEFALGEEILPSEAPQEETTEIQLQMTANKAAVFSQELQPMEEYPQGTLGRDLDASAFEELQKTFRNFPDFILENRQFFTEDAQLRPDSGSRDLLKALNGYFQLKGEAMDPDAFREILSSKGYRKISSDQILQQWTLTPQELTREHSVNDLYQRMSGQLQQLQEAVAGFQKAGEMVSQAADNLSSNIDFMNQIAQLYTYVQIPFRLSGQNVNSELFVYSNKNASERQDDTLSAFLHFDMEHAGSMDISVKLKQKNVSTNWYLDSEDTLLLVEQNISQLTQRLEAKGYTCDMHLDASSHKVDFVEDFLKADVKSTAQVRRYSFDVRA
jgi:hypothetical protein